MAANGLPTAAEMVRGWLLADELLATNQGERRWLAHWARVSRLRRFYVRSVLWLGSAFGLVAGANAAVGHGLVLRSLLWTLAAALAGPIGVWQWRQIVQASVAPFVALPRHRVSAGVFLLLYESALVAGLLWPRHLAVTVGAVLATVAPWFVSAVWEGRRQAPAFPAQWREFGHD